MNAVGGDHDVSRDSNTIGERDDRLLVVLLEADAAVTGVDDVRGQLGDQHFEQVGAVHAVDLDLVNQVWRPHRRDERAIRVAKLRVSPSSAEARDVRGETQSTQHAQAVGLERESGADLGQGRGLLVHANVDTALQQGIRRGQATDTPADDRYAHDID